MSANVDAMVREGINAYKSGQKDEARTLLLRATELDQYNEQAWLWLSGLMDTPEDQRTCLENVLAINPDNERANQGLAYLTGQTSAGNVSPFSASATPPPAYPSSELPSAYSSSAPTSVEWSTPNDAPPQPAWSALTPTAEPVGSELDDWVNNLNLPVNDTMGETSTFTGSSGSPFGDFDPDDDDFGSGPFSSTPLSLDDDEDDAPVTRAAPSRRSPVPAETPERAPAPTPRRNRIARGNGSLLIEADTDRDGESSEGEMFGFIPPEIPLTRLPGTNERTPILLTIGMIVLVVLNVGLGIVIMLNIFT
jgi:hypothetical protein